MSLYVSLLCEFLRDFLRMVHRDAENRFVEFSTRLIPNSLSAEESLDLDIKEVSKLLVGLSARIDLYLVGFIERKSRIRIAQVDLIR